MTRLKRTLRTADGLAMMVGIIVGSGIFRTPGIVARQLGRPILTFVAWVLGGALAFLGTLVFAELAARLPQAGGKYVYAREAFGRRAAFVVGWVEALGMYAAAIAAIGTVGGEYLGRLLGAPAGSTPWLAAGWVALFTWINLVGVASGRWVQNVVTAAKLLALAGLVVVAFATGSGAGPSTVLPAAPRGVAVWGALAVAFRSVIWTYYGYADAAKDARQGTAGIATVIALYLLLNAAFLHVLPIERIAASNLVAGDVAQVIFGAKSGIVMAALALLVVLAGLNGNVFVTPRVIFGLARDGLAPGVFARVNAGGTPWAAMLLVGVVSIALVATGTFERLLALAITLVLVVDGAMVFALVRLRREQPDAPFLVPFYPLVPLLFVGVYAALFVGTALEQPALAALTIGLLVAVYGLSWTVRERH